MTIEERRKLQEAIRHNRIKKSSDTASENKTTDKYSGLREAVRNGRIKTQPSSAPSTEALQTVEPLSVEEKEDIKAGAIRPLSVNLTEEQKAEVKQKEQAREKEKVDAARVRIADPNADKKSEQYIKDKTLVIGYDALNNETYKNAKASPALTFEIFGGPTYEAVKLYNSLGFDDEHVDNQILKSDAYYLTPEQRQVVRILGNNRKWDDLEEYLKGVKPEAEQKHNEAINRDVKQFVKELPPVLDAAVDTGIGIASMATSLATIPQNVKSWITGGEIDLNDGANLITTMAKASGEAMSEKINNETIGFLYEVGQSIVEMGASIAAGNAVGAATGLVSLASKIPLTLMSASAAAQAVSDATERGLDSTQAIALGSVSAAASWLLEKVPLDNLLNVKNLNISSIKEILKNTAKQAGIEGFEEAGEEAINMIADEIITAYNGKSNVEIEVEKMVESGVPENTAYAKVIVGNLLQSAAGGALAGGFMGGVSNTGRYIGIKSSEKKLDKTLKKAASEGNKEVAIDALDESIKADIDTKNAIRNTKQIEKAEKVEIIDKLNADIKRKTTLKDTLRNADWSDKESINKILNIRPETGEESRIDDLEKNEAAEAEAEREAEATRQATVNATAQNEAVATETTPTVENAVESDSESVGGGKEITLEEASGKYGAEAETMRNAYAPKQNVAQYDKAYKMAYDMGMSGVPIAEALNDKATSYLTETQRRNAYEAGQRVSESRANEQDTLNKNAANGKTGRKRGAVKGEGVTIADLKKTFNDPQGKAYKILSTIADVTGIDIVLYKSEANEKGEFEGAQGRFKLSEDTIYIDINAGIKNLDNVGKLAKYSMLRTFSHEFTHFLEKWNPLMYNEFRKTVFAELEARGENVHDLIELKKADGMEYEEASREVVAEAMTDILPEASFIETLAQKHKNISETLLARLKEFVSDLKEYFNSLAKNPSREANALKEQIGDTVRYAENIVKMFDEVAVQAVENYQATVATEEKTVTETAVDATENAEKSINPEKIVSIQGINPENIDSTEGIDVEVVKEETKPSAQYQSRAYLPDDDVQEQQRTEPLTDEEVLELAAEELYNKGNLSDAERDALVIFQGRVGELTELRSKRAEQGRLYKEQQFGEEVDREAAAETLSRMRILDSQIKKASEDVLSVENKAIFKSILQKARKVVETRQREYDAEKLRRYREHRDNAETIRKVKSKLNSDVKEMIGWITHPNSKDIKKHIPDSLKDVVTPFLQSIDFSSKTKLEKGENTAADERFYKRMKNLQEVLENYAAGKDIDGSGILADMVLPEDFLADLNDQLKTIRKIIEANSGRFVINEMTAEELKNLHKVVKILKNSIRNVNTFYNQGVFKHVSDAGDSGIEYMNELSDHSNKWIDRAWDKIWAHLKPYEGFKLFGESGKAIFKTLQKAQAKLAFNEKAIESFVEEAYKPEEVKAWEKQVITSKMSGKEVKATVAQVMGLYELSKDPEGKKHILNGGIRFSYSKPKTSLFNHDHGLELSEDHGHILTEEELNEMTSKLTERQKEVADKIQQFLAKDCGRLGNEVSVIRFGERLFNNPFYYPISVDERKLSADKANEEMNKNASLYALLNMGFTKQREGSKKRVVVYSIFDVLAGHSSDMARYNAFALPLIDTIKWLNYKQVEIDENGRKIERDSIRDQMARVYGAPPTEGNKQTVGYAENFVTSIIKAMNGTESQGSKFDSFGTRTLHRYNVAQVAYNLSTAIQQPLSMIRAAMVLSPESIIGNPFNAKEVKENKEEMLKYSGIAVWKSLGFYDVNISRGVSELIKNDRTKLDKFIDTGMKGAEFMDMWTWASIWGACKKEVTKKQKLNEGSPEFYKAVTDLFEEVVYSTQVVDSVFTKTEYMRNQSAIPRILSSFMSEPVTTANMVFSALNKVKTDEQHGMSWKEAVKKNADTISRTIAVYSVAAILNAAVQAARDALRDDDEYETFPQKAAEAFWSNFIDEIIPFNKLPILSNFWEFGKMTLSKFGVDTYGYAPQSVILQGYDQAGKAIEILFDKDSKYTLTGKAYKLLQAASSISGLPMSNIMREVVTIHNNTIGLLDNEYITHYYDKGDKNYIKNAYLEGNISEEEAVQELISLDLAEDENEAYWMLQESSKYAKLLDAAFNGKSIEKASEELIAHGVTKKEIHSRIKSAVKQRFKDGRITEEEAVAVLQKYLKIPSYSAMVMLQNWDD